MKVTNTTNSKFKFVSRPTIDILNYVAAKNFVCKGEGNHNGYFYSTVDDVSKATGIPRSTAHRHLIKLCELEIVEVRKAGQSKSIYKVNPFEVTNF